ncbi:hypothetical protein WA158_004238 [Blastocystis sp. Blastoise]
MPLFIQFLEKDFQSENSSINTKKVLIEFNNTMSFENGNVFFQGELVFVNWCLQNSWYKGRISRLRENCADVVYDNGSAELSVPLDWLTKKQPADGDVVQELPCSICFSYNFTEKNMIVICDGCGQQTHRKCYHVKDSIEDLNDSNKSWFCRLCQAKKTQSVKQNLCMICYQRLDDGIAIHVKKDNVWVHACCAEFIPEIKYTKGHEEVVALSTINPDRKLLRCNVCRQMLGYCIQCSTKDCRASYHPYCGFKAGYIYKKLTYINEKENTYSISKLSFCRHHSSAMMKTIWEARLKSKNENILFSKFINDVIDPESNLKECIFPTCLDDNDSDDDEDEEEETNSMINSTTITTTSPSKQKSKIDINKEKTKKTNSKTTDSRKTSPKKQVKSTRKVNAESLIKIGSAYMDDDEEDNGIHESMNKEVKVTKTPRTSKKIKDTTNSNKENIPVFDDEDSPIEINIDISKEEKNNKTTVSTSEKKEKRTKSNDNSDTTNVQKRSKATRTSSSSSSSSSSSAAASNKENTINSTKAVETRKEKRDIKEKKKETKKSVETKKNKEIPAKHPVVSNSSNLPTLKRLNSSDNSKTEPIPVIRNNTMSDISKHYTNSIRQEVVQKKPTILNTTPSMPINTFATPYKLTNDIRQVRFDKLVQMITNKIYTHSV